MPGKTYRYTDSDIKLAVKASETVAQVLDKLGLVKAGGNYASIKRKISRLGIDASHFKGQGWSCGKALKDFHDYKNMTAIKKRLIEERTHSCESCDNTEWLSFPIALEVHHVDGIRSNNGRDNLQLLCPNCHSFTDNWRGRNIK